MAWPNSRKTREAAGGDPTFVRHTCNGGRGPNFGRKTPGCPRCDELAAGAPARDVPGRLRGVIRQRQIDEQQAAESRDHHRPGGPHANGECGPVCTFGDW
ncbi:hypothetical protein [Plantactinospora sp. WMMB782]|uniref:hypothetical protein n=1 Tax=Plantactinospora sp. WMMB782 TaxID=3404121 RepID=UPI003B95033E